MTNVSWTPGKLTITLTAEPVERLVALDLCGIDVGRRGELRTVELLLLRPRLGNFSFGAEEVLDLRNRWGIDLTYNRATDCAVVAVSNVPSDHSDGCDARIGLTRAGQVGRIEVEGNFRSP
ncbi:MAG TPA: hypothetical protein VFY93_01155 [Planctomycetota bacterium]|nr:hypothetical protein [Planctomycetota bacterium]